ncbi:MAG TPA: phosphate propanoyltransferase [Anaerovoracaceae bacterium]|nr:phosphate propanoyltransferase [Anaerovoracaceae bacterium]
MDHCEGILNLLLGALQAAASSTEESPGLCIPVGVSNRHIHLCQNDLSILFGESYQLTRMKELSQPGQYACEETVTICGPKCPIEKVRILGPVRAKTQVEVLLGDCIRMGIRPHIRLSGDLDGTPGIVLIGPKGSIQIKEGVIVAQRHIHMTPQDARHFEVHDGQVVRIQSDGPRGGIYDNVTIRASDASKLECHIDTEETNAMNMNSMSKITIIK